MIRFSPSTDCVFMRCSQEGSAADFKAGTLFKKEPELKQRVQLKQKQQITAKGGGLNLLP